MTSLAAFKTQHFAALGLQLMIVSSHFHMSLFSQDKLLEWVPVKES